MPVDEESCVRELNGNYLFVYLLLWVSLVILIAKMVLIMLHYLSLLCKRKFRGDLINATYYRKTLPVEKLNSVCSINIGAFLIIERLAKTIRPVHFDRLIDSLYIKVRSSKLDWV